MLDQRLQRRESFSLGCSSLLTTLGPNLARGVETNPTQKHSKCQNSPWTTLVSPCSLEEGICIQVPWLC